jgi:hypothetical protein
MFLKREEAATVIVLVRAKNRSNWLRNRFSPLLIVTLRWNLRSIFSFLLINSFVYCYCSSIEWSRRIVVIFKFLNRCLGFSRFVCETQWIENEELVFCWFNFILRFLYFWFEQVRLVVRWCVVTNMCCRTTSQQKSVVNHLGLMIQIWIF